MTTDIIAEMRAYQGQREQGLTAAAAGVVLALPGMGIGGSSLAQAGVRAGMAAGAGELATTLAAAAPIGIAASTLAAPLMIGQHMVEAGRVHVEVDELPPAMRLTPTQTLPTSTPPSQPVLPLPVVPPITDNTARVNTSPLTTPASVPHIQTGTPPMSSGQVPPLPLMTTPVQDDRLRQLVTDPLLAKPINLPAWDKVTLDMEHVVSGHTATGGRAIQSGQKDLFPAWMGEAQIAKAIETAYKDSKRVGALQDDKVLLRGFAGGLLIEMILNLETKEIETAYPPSR